MTPNRAPQVQLSVVIAAFNAAETLADALEALAVQQVPFAWEVIVSDNGSADATAEIAHSYAGRVPRLVVVDSSEQRGPAAARNIGSAAAVGEHLAFCDADDVVAPGWVAAMGEALRESAIVTGTSRRRELNARPGDDQFHEWSRYVAPFFPQLPGAGAGNLGVRAEVFNALHGFDTALRTGEDVDLCWRAQLAGYRLDHAPGAVVDVSNREGLRATFRQHYSYGAGNRLLLEKYAQVIPAFAALPAWEAPQGAEASEVHPSPPVHSLVGRVARKLTRTRGLKDLTHLASRAGYIAGRRWGRNDGTVEPLPMPPQGPRVP